MSLLIAVPLALGAAAAYGCGTALQHGAAQALPDSGVRGLAGLLRDPRWLLGTGADAVGLLMQILALTTGPVVLIQPLLILALPVSLPIAALLGAERADAAQLRGCAAILFGLGLFFALIGDPGRGRPLTVRSVAAVAAVVVLSGVVGLLVARGRSGVVTAVVYGGVAGSWFGFVAVLMDATGTAFSRHGVRSFGHLQALLPVLILVGLGVLSIALTQAAFRAGPLAAAFPANLVADPVVAVVLGAILLHERIPLSAVRLVGYALGFAAVLAGAISLASQHRRHRAPRPAQS